MVLEGLIPLHRVDSHWRYPMIMTYNVLDVYKNKVFVPKDNNDATISNQITLKYPSKQQCQYRILLPHFPIQLRKMTDDETKEYHLKKLLNLSVKSIRKSRRYE